MSTVVDFDPAQYTSMPNLDVPSLIALARQLEAAAPAHPPVQVRQSLANLMSLARELEESYRAHLQRTVSEDARPIGQAAGNAWACLHGRLASYAALPTEQCPKAPTAQELVDKLFPTGLSFLKLEYGAQWVEAEQRVQLIKQEKLKGALDELAGPEFLVELLRSHQLYGEAVGVSRPKSARRKPPDLRKQRLLTQQAMVLHAIQLVALYLHGGEKLLEAIQPSLSAIDAYREKATPKKKAPQPDAAPPPAP